MLDYKRDDERKNGHLRKVDEKKEAKEEDFFNFKKNKKSDLGQLEINVTWLPTPKISNKKTHETRKQEWKE